MKRHIGRQADLMNVGRQAAAKILSENEFEDYTLQILKDLGFSANFAQRVFDQAYTEGHSFGFVEVAIHLDDYIDMVLGNHNEMPKLTESL